MQSQHIIFFLSSIALLNSIFYTYPKTVLAEDKIDIQKTADKACAFMSGRQRLDPEILQFLEKVTLGVDVGNYNQIAIDLDRQLLKQCPKAYITFQHRNIINNPLLQAINPLANPLGNPSPTLLTSPNANPTVNANTSSFPNPNPTPSGNSSNIPSANSSATPTPSVNPNSNSSANSNSLAISSFNSSDLSLNPSEITSLNPSVTSSANSNADRSQNSSAKSSVTPNTTQPDRSKINSPSQTKDRQEIAKYDEAIRQNPNDAKVYLARGKDRYDRKNYQEALADYTEAIRLEPKNPLGYANRALVKNYLGDKQGTIADLQIAAKLFEANGDRDNHQKVLNLLQQIRE